MASLCANKNIRRPSTPHANGTPSLGARAATSGSVSPLPPSTLSSGVSVSKGTPKKDFESQVLESIELDLGDF